MHASAAVLIQPKPGLFEPSPVPSCPRSRRFEGENGEQACPSRPANPRFSGKRREMTEPNQECLRAALLELALRLGGVFAAHAVDDELIAVIARQVGRVVDRHISEAAGRSPPMDPGNRKPRSGPHPAIVDLLTRIGVSATPPARKANGESGWIRLPGLFRRWEFEQVIDVDQEFLVEEAGHDEHGMSLYAIFSRPHVRKEAVP